MTVIWKKKLSTDALTSETNDVFFGRGGPESKRGFHRMANDGAPTMTNRL